VPVAPRAALVRRVVRVQQPDQRRESLVFELGEERVDSLVGVERVAGDV
jgi:hypothetical protein